MSQPESVEILPPWPFARALSGWLLGLLFIPLGIGYLLLKGMDRAPVLMSPLAFALLIGTLLIQFWAMIHLGHWLKGQGLLACLSAGLIMLPTFWVYYRAQLPPGNYTDLALLWIGIGLGMLLEPTGRLADRMKVMDPGSLRWGVHAGLVMFGLMAGLSALFPEQALSSSSVWMKGAHATFMGTLTAILTHRIVSRSWPIIALATLSAGVMTLSPLLRRMSFATHMRPLLLGLWLLGLLAGLGIARAGYGKRPQST